MIAANVKFEFLLPYLPDYNPIEETFTESEVGLKKHYLLVNKYETYSEFLEDGLRVIRLKPGKHFSHIALRCKWSHKQINL